MLFILLMILNIGHLWYFTLPMSTKLKCRCFSFFWFGHFLLLFFFYYYIPTWGRRVEIILFWLKFVAGTKGNGATVFRNCSFLVNPLCSPSLYPFQFFFISEQHLYEHPLNPPHYLLGPLFPLISCWSLHHLSIPNPSSLIPIPAKNVHRAQSPPPPLPLVFLLVYPQLTTSHPSSLLDPCKFASQRPRPG